MKNQFGLAMASGLVLTGSWASIAQGEIPADRKIYRYCYSHDLKTKTTRYSQVFIADIYKRPDTETAFATFLAAGARKLPRVDCGDGRDRSVVEQRKRDRQSEDSNSNIIEIQWVESAG